MRRRGLPPVSVPHIDLGGGAAFSWPFLIRNLIEGDDTAAETNNERIQAHIDGGPDYAPWLILQYGEYFFSEPIRLETKVGLSGLGEITVLRAAAAFAAGPIILGGLIKAPFPQGPAIFDDADFSYEFSAANASNYFNLSKCGVYPKNFTEFWFEMGFTIASVPGLPSYFVDLGGNLSGNISAESFNVRWNVDSQTIAVLFVTTAGSVTLVTTTDFSADIGTRHMIAVGWDGADVNLFVDGVIEDTAPLAGTFTTTAYEEFCVGGALRGGFPNHQIITTIPNFNLGGMALGNAVLHTVNYVVDWNTPAANPASDHFNIICQDEWAKDDLVKLRLRGNSYGWMQINDDSTPFTTSNISIEDLKFAGSVVNQNTAIQVFASPETRIRTVTMVTGQGIDAIDNCYLSELEDIKHGIGGGRWGISWNGGVSSFSGFLRSSDADIPLVINGGGSVELVHIFNYTTVGALLACSGTIESLNISDEGYAGQAQLYCTLISVQGTGVPYGLTIENFACDITTNDTTIPIGIDSVGSGVSANINISGGGGQLGGLTTPPVEMIDFIDAADTDPIIYSQWNNQDIPVSSTPYKVLSADGRSTPLDIAADADATLNWRVAPCHRLPADFAITANRTFTLDIANIQPGQVKRFIRENQDAFIVTVLAAGATTTVFPEGEIGWCDYIYDGNGTFTRIGWEIRPAPTPEDILGAALEMWLRADTDVLNGGLPVSDSDPIEEWLDITSNNHDCLQSTGENQPDFELTGGPDGQPCIRFGSNQWFEIANLFDSLTEAEIFWVGSFAADPPVLAQQENTPYYLSDAPNDCHWPWSTSDVFANFGKTARENIGTIAADMTDWHIINEISTSTEFTVNVDGVQEFTTGTNTVGFSAALARIGRGLNLQQMNGAHAEIIMTNRKLTTSERTLINNYLASRYPSI